MDETIKELRSKLENVPKSYEDFVEGISRQTILSIEKKQRGMT